MCACHTLMVILRLASPLAPVYVLIDMIRDPWDAFRTVINAWDMFWAAVISPTPFLNLSRNLSARIERSWIREFEAENRYLIRKNGMSDRVKEYDACSTT
jgi:hypothetical protein